ncbi:hypothetical protein WAI453_008062 [Rhynchosporium graminicola]|uniref:RGS domain-containing protein n=1 Tax=Rhynchosporium graminicola TaxID=2792576 RepID=A0A1E1K8Q6_9HELO|nr:uncharacterized protein RCO7_10101 [Rhynchosporium commune]
MPQYPDWMRWYKKPSYVDVNQFATTISDKAGTVSNPSSPRNSIETKRKSSHDIPSKLSLERILKNRTCSPMSLYDFYMYLKYIEHSSENLEFYIWFKNFEAGRLTAFPELPRALTPVDVNGSGTSSQTSLAKPGNYDNFKAEKSQSTKAQDNFEFEDSEIYARIASFISPGGACGPKGCDNGRLSPLYKRPFSVVERIVTEAEAKTSTEIDDMRRAELETIRTLFLLPGSPKELNLPAPMRRKVLDAIATSTDPKHFAPVAEHCYLLLKSCSHRNFIRLGVSNGTFETICMATGLGIVLTVSGFLAMLLLAFASPSFRHCSRWRGLGVWPMWSVGIGLILSGLRGSCFFLLLFSRRQPLPWERFEDDPIVTKKSRFIRLVSKLMIFDRKMKVKDDALRRLQRKVVLQSIMGGMGFATLFVIVFLCLPIWKKV